MSLEIPLLGPQGTVLAWDWLPDSHASDGTSTVSHTVAANSSMAMPRVMDKRYYFLNGLYAGMAVFDVEMTQHCISEQECREANPVMPSSQAGQLSVNFALVAFDAGYSNWLKKHHHKVWWIPPLSGSVVHAVGVATASSINETSLCRRHPGTLAKPDHSKTATLLFERIGQISRELIQELYAAVQVIGTSAYI